MNCTCIYFDEGFCSRSRIITFCRLQNPILPLEKEFGPSAVGVSLQNTGNLLPDNAKLIMNYRQLQREFPAITINKKYASTRNLNLMAASSDGRLHHDNVTLTFDLLTTKNLISSSLSQDNQ